MIKTRSWQYEPEENRFFHVNFHFVGWHSIQLGIHFDFKMLNMELHLPFCFIRIGKTTAIKNVTIKEQGNE